MGCSAFGHRGDNSIGWTRTAGGVLSWGQTGSMDAASRIHQRRKGNPLGSGVGRGQEAVEGGRWCARRSETPASACSQRGGAGGQGVPSTEDAGPSTRLEQEPGRPVQGAPSRPSFLPPSSPLCAEPAAITWAGPRGFKPSSLTSEALPRHVRRGLLTRPLGSPPGSAPCSCIVHSEAAPGSL